MPDSLTDRLVAAYRGACAAIPDARRDAHMQYCIDHAARFYNVAHLARFRPALAALVPEVAGGRMLDLCAGDGHWSFCLSPYVQKVYCLDLSYAIIQLAADIGERLGHEAPATFTCGTAYALPFPDGCFDSVVVHSALHLIDRERTLAEIRRVLAPSGFLYCGVTGPGRIHAALGFLSEKEAQGAANRRLLANLRILTADAIFRAGVAPPKFSTTKAPTVEEMSFALRCYGFEPRDGPSIQDYMPGQTEWQNRTAFPATFDVMGRRNGVDGTDALPGPAALIEGGLPRLAAATLNDAAACPRLRLYAAVKIADDGPPDFRLVARGLEAARNEAERCMMTGLVALAGREYGPALKAFTELGGDENWPDAPYLAVVAMLCANRHRPAQRGFAALRDAEPHRLRSWVGLLHALYLMEDPRAVLREGWALERALAVGSVTAL